MHYIYYVNAIYIVLSIFVHKLITIFFCLVLLFIECHVNSEIKFHAFILSCIYQFVLAM